MRRLYAREEDFAGSSLSGPAVEGGAESRAAGHGDVSAGTAAPVISRLPIAGAFSSAQAGAFLQKSLTGLGREEPEAVDAAPESEPVTRPGTEKEEEKEPESLAQAGGGLPMRQRQSAAAPAGKVTTAGGRKEEREKAGEKARYGAETLLLGTINVIGGMASGNVVQVIGGALAIFKAIGSIIEEQEKKLKELKGSLRGKAHRRRKALIRIEQKLGEIKMLESLSSKIVKRILYYNKKLAYWKARESYYKREEAKATGEEAKQTWVRARNFAMGWRRFCANMIEADAKRALAVSRKVKSLHAQIDMYRRLSRWSAVWSPVYVP